MVKSEVGSGRSFTLGNCATLGLADRVFKRLLRIALSGLAAITVAVSAGQSQELSPQAPHAEISQSDAAKMPVLPLNEEVLHLQGDRARPVDLEVTLFKPSGVGPFPLAVINHGANKASDQNKGERQRFALSAYYFLSRGYAVALPMMRGYAGSGGHMLQLGCNLVTTAQSNGRDIRAVIEDLARRADIDGSRVVVTGQSFGGWNTLGLGTAPPAGVRGLVLFNAALRDSSCPANEQDKSLVAAGGRFGLATALPSLWFYGENDTIMPTATWRGVFDQYKNAGARAELVDIGRFGTDSHQFLGSLSSLPLWAPKLDGFLAGIGMPASDVNPGYLPMPSPPPTHWANLLASTVIPYLNDKGRTLYSRFLAAPRPRAFVIAPNGSATLTAGVYDTLGKALQQCARGSPLCKPYAVDDDVVWSGPKPGEPTRVVSKSIRKDAGTLLATFLEISKDCSSRGHPKITISADPAHGTIAVGERMAHPAFPPNSPLFACNTASVSGLTVTYTPSPGFSGQDALTLDEVSLEGRHQIIRLNLTVF